MDAENADVRGQFLILQNAHASFFDVGGGDRRDRGGFGNAVNEQQRGERDADFHRDREIGENGEAKSGEPHRLIGVRQAQDGSNVAPLTHVISDDKKNGGQGRKRNKRASGAATSRIRSRVRACTIPATGVFAPQRMLVAVRAMAPVAGMPPKSGDARLAMPCAINSTFEL